MTTPQRLPIVNSDDGTWGDIIRQYLMKEHYNDDLDHTYNGGHQNVTIRPGTASLAPLTLTSGTNLTTAAAGSVEYNGTYFYLTPGSTRKTVAIYDDSSGANGDIYYRDGSGSLIRLPAGGTNTLLNISSGIPAWTNTIGNANTITLKDANFTLQDNGDVTKQANFQLSGITSGQTRTLTVPDASGTLALSGDVVTKATWEQSVTGGANLVYDPQFNDSTLDHEFTAGGGGGGVSYSTDQAHSGTTSYKVITSNLTSGQFDLFYLLSHNLGGGTARTVASALKVQPGQRFYFEIYIRQKNTNTNVAGVIYLVFWLSDSTGVNSPLYSLITVTQASISNSSWTKASGTATIPAGYDLAWPSINFQGQTVANQSWYFDDARILDVSDPLVTLTDTQTLTNKTISGSGNTLSNIALGSLAAVAYNTSPTASTLAEWDSNANLSADVFIPGTASTVTAAGITTLTIADKQVQIFTGSTTQTVKLPTTSVVTGQTYTIVNQSSGAVTVQSSGANTILVLGAFTTGVFTATASPPTTNAHWMGSAISASKTLTVSNSLALAGTDSTTMTFPSTSATIARTDAANAFTGHQTIEGVTSTGATGTGKFVFDTSPVLTTPNLGTPSALTLTSATGLPLTGLASAAYNTTPTASTLAEWDANKNLSTNALIPGFTTTATSASPVTLTISSTQTQVFTGSTAQTVRLPTTSVVAGAQYVVINNSSAITTVQSSGSNTITAMAANTTATFTAVVATPTTAANWSSSYVVGGTSTFADNVFTLQDDGDATKQAQFQLSGITTATTRTLTVPNASTTIVGTDATQTLTNKTISGTSNTLSSIALSSLSTTGTPSSTTYLRGDGAWTAAINSIFTANVGDGSTTSYVITHNLGTRNVSISLYDATTFEEVNCDKFRTSTNTVTLTFVTAPATNAYVCVIVGGALNTTINSTDVADSTSTGRSLLTAASATAARTTISAISATSTDTLQNKTIDNSNTVTLKDTLFTLQDNSDTTKQLQLDLVGIATSTTRTLTVPNANTTIVGTDATQTLTNKTFDSTSPTAFHMPGMIIAYGSRTAPSGWLSCDGTAVSRTTNAALFAAIAPSLGTFTVTIAAPAVVTKTTHGLSTGDSVYLTTTSALPTGLTANTLYYIVRIDANSFNLSTSRANAYAATKITTTGTQSGTHTVWDCPHGLGDGSTTFNVPDIRGRMPAGLDTTAGTAASRLTLAQSQGVYGNQGATGGEQGHQLITAELAVHSHSRPGQVTAFTGGAGAGALTGGDAANTGNAGGDTAHNNVQPTILVNYIIKT